MYMLHALGITHVVSVGECALVPPPVAVNALPESDDGYTFERTPPRGSLWREEKEGRIKVLDIKVWNFLSLHPKSAPLTFYCFV